MGLFDDVRPPGGILGDAPVPPPELPAEEQAAPGLTPEIEQRKAERQKLLENLKRKEDELRGSLLRKTVDVGGSVDRELDSLLKEAGVSFGQARRTAGAQQARGGLLRSGFTQSRLEDIRASELETGGQLRTGAEQIKRQADLTRQQAVRGVADRRTEIRNRLTDLEIQGLSNARFQEEAQKIQLDFDSFINDLEISAQGKLDLASAFGGIAQLGGLAAGLSTGGTGGTTTTTPTTTGGG